MIDPLARLIAIEEIRQLKARYFRLMDLRDFTAMAEVFTTDAVFDCTDGGRVEALGGGWSGPPGPVLHGREPIMAWVRAAFGERVCAHHGHAHEVTVTSDSEASGIVAMADYILAPDRRTLLLQAAGHYHEDYRIEDGAWRIASTRLTRLFRLDGLA